MRSVALKNTRTPHAHSSCAYISAASTLSRSRIEETS
jgi:hypothetical protein